MAMKTRETRTPMKFILPNCLHMLLCGSLMAQDVEFVDRVNLDIEVVEAVTTESEVEGSAESLLPPMAPNAPSSITEAELGQIRARVEQALELQTTTLQQLDSHRLVREHRIPVELDGERRELRLYPYSMRSDNLVVFVEDEKGLFREEAPPPITTFRGSIVEEPTSEVVASIIDGRLFAAITTSKGAWAIEPVSKTLPDVPAGLHAVYRVSDVVPPAGVCGVDAALVAHPLGPGPKEPGVVEALGTGGRTQIGFDTDAEYYQANGSSTSATISDIEKIMNQVGLIYQNQFSICYVIEAIIVRTNVGTDPYSATNPDTLLCQFADEWNSNVTTTRDVAHLMTGKNLDGTTIGIAWTGVICDQEFTNCNGGRLHYGLSQTFFSTNLVSRTGLTAHELGHNWNACHCNQGACTGDGADADCGIMWSASGTQQSTLVFGSRSTAAITSHRDSRTCLGTCIDPIYVNLNNNPLIENGTAEFPFDTVSEGVKWVQVGGTVIITTGSYAETLRINKIMDLVSSGGPVTIGK